MFDLISNVLQAIQFVKCYFGFHTTGENTHFSDFYVKKIVSLECTSCYKSLGERPANKEELEQIKRWEEAVEICNKKQAMFEVKRINQQKIEQAIKLHKTLREKHNCDCKCKQK